MLAEEIGTGRYKLWANPSQDPKAPQRTFSKSATRPDDLDTYRRTMLHSEYTPTAEYQTSNQVVDPGYCVYTNPAKGAREAMLEKRAMDLAKASAPPPDSVEPQLMTTHRQVSAVR